MRLPLTIALLSWSVTFAQDTTATKPLQVQGYIKNLQSLDFQAGFGGLVTGNLIHNRVNVKWSPRSDFSGAAEFRNRLFWGEEVRLTPAFPSRLRNASEALDLSHNWIDNGSIVLNSTVDRLWIQYGTATWNVRVGRQRVNWGIGTTWNPNDLFNTFNFLDFDYEERPGADAIKLQRYTGDFSNVEIALSLDEDLNVAIGAARYFVNVSGYDLQWIAGWFNRQPTLGFGWTGSIKESGFKGELQYYFNRDGRDEQLNFSLEIDHVFAGGWYANAGGFVNSNGIAGAQETDRLALMNFSAKNLMPTRWNALTMVSKSVTPLMTISSTVIYAPGADLLLFLPAVSYNLTQEVDVDLVWQSFFGQSPHGFSDLSHRVFLRMKLSF